MVIIIIIVTNSVSLFDICRHGSTSSKPTATMSCTFREECGWRQRTDSDVNAFYCSVEIGEIYHRTVSSALLANMADWLYGWCIA